MEEYQTVWARATRPRNSLLVLKHSDPTTAIDSLAISPPTRRGQDSAECTPSSCSGFHHRAKCDRRIHPAKPCTFFPKPCWCGEQTRSLWCAWSLGSKLSHYCRKVKQIKCTWSGIATAA